MTVLLFAATSSTGPLAASTPIIAAAGGLIVANADGPPNLIGSLTATLKDPAGHIVVDTPQVTIVEDSDLGNDTWRYVARLVAPLTAGSYTIVWQGPETDQTASESVVVEIGVRPSVASIGALLRARTKILGGTEVGTFTAATRPTDTEVEFLIDQAQDEVGGKVQPVDSTLAPGDGFNAPGGAYERRYRQAVALYTAILIELSYWPEQVAQNQSPVAAYREMFDSRIRALITEGEVGRPGGMGEGASGAGDAPADSYWSFPDAAPGALVGWASRW